MAKMSFTLVSTTKIQLSNYRIKAQKYDSDFLLCANVTLLRLHMTFFLMLTANLSVKDIDKRRLAAMMKQIWDCSTIMYNLQTTATCSKSPTCGMNQTGSLLRHRCPQSITNSKPSEVFLTASLFSVRHRMLHHSRVTECQTETLVPLSLSDNMQHTHNRQDNLLDNRDLRPAVKQNVYPSPVVHFHGNYVIILHCFWDLARYWSKITDLPCIWHPYWGDPIHILPLSWTSKD